MLRGGRRSLLPALYAPIALRSPPPHPTSPPGWPGSPPGCEQTLPYLQTLVICTPICGQMASWLAPGHPRLEGALLSVLCLAIWAGAHGGGSPSGGGPAQPRLWGLQPQNHAVAWSCCSQDAPQAREPRPSRPPVLARFGSRPSNVGEGWSCRSH